MERSMPIVAFNSEDLKTFLKWPYNLSPYNYLQEEKDTGHRCGREKKKSQFKIHEY